MYDAMATAVHMDYTLPLKQGTSFQMLLLTWGERMWAIYAVYAIAYTSNLQKHGAFLKYCTCVFVLTPYVITMVLTSERH